MGLRLRLGSDLSPRVSRCVGPPVGLVMALLRDFASLLVLLSSACCEDTHLGRCGRGLWMCGTAVCIRLKEDGFLMWSTSVPAHMRPEVDVFILLENQRPYSSSPNPKPGGGVRLFACTGEKLSNTKCPAKSCLKGEEKENALSTR